MQVIPPRRRARPPRTSNGSIPAPVLGALMVIPATPPPGDDDDCDVDSPDTDPLTPEVVDDVPVEFVLELLLELELELELDSEEVVLDDEELEELDVVSAGQVCVRLKVCASPPVGVPPALSAWAIASSSVAPAGADA